MKETKVMGIGFNDMSEPATCTINGKRKVCPYYDKWSGMLQRVVRLGCTCSEEWLYRSKFTKDIKEMELQYKVSVGTGHDCCLDKDLKIFGNRHYSKETCVLIPNIVNCLFQDSGSIRGKLPLGVTHRKDLEGKSHLVYRAQCSEPFTHRQIRKSFDCPYKAHNHWKELKLQMILSVADIQIPEIKQLLHNRAELLKQAIEHNLEVKSLSKPE